MGEGEVGWDDVWKRLRYLKDENEWLRNNLLTILKKSP